MDALHEWERSNKSSREETEFNELIDVFIGKSQYHKLNFRKRNSGKSKFNVAAFFFSAYWLLFKSLFQYGALCILAVLIMAVLIPNPYYRVVGLGLQAAFGFKGNDLYYHYIQKHVDAAMLVFNDQDQRINFLRRKKKRNFIAGSILFVIFVSLSAIGRML